MPAWSLYSKETDRDYVGNTGYPDVLGTTYAYDSRVPNHRKIAVGDLVVLRDDRQVFGVAAVEDVTSEPAQKVVLECPNCRRTGFSPRKKRLPQYLCRQEGCRAEFDVPVHTTIDVTQYAARYGSSWRALDGAVGLDELDSVFLDRAKQNAIRGLHPAGLTELLHKKSVKPPEPGDRTSVPRSPAGGVRIVPTIARIGQGEFRDGLLRMYGLTCAITGPCPAEALQASHLKPFAVHHRHDLQQGILLRADLHLLMDGGMLTINPDTWTVRVAPSLRDYGPYRELDGAPVMRGPDPDAIREHYERVTATW